MAEPTTQAAAQTQLDEWWAALSAVSTGQSYSIGGRQLLRVDVPEIRKTIAYLTTVRNSFRDAARTDRVQTPGFRVATWSGTVS